MGKTTERCVYCETDAPLIIEASGPFYVAKCSNCGKRGIASASEQDAVDLWNYVCKCIRREMSRQEDETCS
jgi:hypothetical protein